MYCHFHNRYLNQLTHLVNIVNNVPFFTFPIFTNLGPIEESRLVFDKKPINAWVIVPTGNPPFLGVGMSGYKGTLTLSAGTFKNTRDTVENMFDIMLKELPS